MPFASLRVGEAIDSDFIPVGTLLDSVQRNNKRIQSAS